jgi:hypothetical protein
MTGTTAVATPFTGAGIIIFITGDHAGDGNHQYQQDQFIQSFHNQFLVTMTKVLN